MLRRFCLLRKASAQIEARVGSGGAIGARGFGGGGGGFGAGGGLGAGRGALVVSQTGGGAAGTGGGAGACRSSICSKNRRICSGAASHSRLIFGGGFAWPIGCGRDRGGRFGRGFGGVAGASSSWLAD